MFRKISFVTLAKSFYSDRILNLDFLEIPVKYCQDIGRWNFTVDLNFTMPVRDLYSLFILLIFSDKNSDSHQVRRFHKFLYWINLENIAEFTAESLTRLQSSECWYPRQKISEIQKLTVMKLRISLGEIYFDVTCAIRTGVSLLITFKKILCHRIILLSLSHLCWDKSTLLTEWKT